MSKQAINDGNETFLAAMKSNDLAQMLAPLTDDVVFMPPNQAVLNGKGAVKGWFEQLLSQMRTSDVSVSEREVLVGGDWGYEQGSFVWKLTPVAGGAPVEDRGNFVALWQRQSDGSWKLARDIWNSTRPLPDAR